MAEVAEFTAAAAAGDLPKVRATLAEAPRLLNMKDGDGATALHHAAIHAHQEVVRWLVSQGADVNARDERFGATPTGWAIEYLRELGGCLGMEIEDVVLAMQRSEVDWLKRFLDRTPALVECVDRQGTPLLEHAASSGVAEIRALFYEAIRRRKKG
jgi:hypothetical protein